MRRLPKDRLLFAALVVLALAGIYVAAGTSHPARATAVLGQAAKPGRAPVSTAQRVCAAPGSAGVTAGSVALAAVPGSAPPGSAVIARLTPGGGASPGPGVATSTDPFVPQFTQVPVAPPLTKPQQASQPGSGPRVSTQTGRGGVEVTATGSMAQGLDVEQTGERGLVTAQCGAPGTDFWFVGPGQTSAATIELYLMNAGDQAADAAVTALTDVTKGAPLLGNADNGIAVPPHSMVVQNLGAMLQGSKVMALNVTTSVGQVGVALRESNSGTSPGGWLPATRAPARNVVIPGLPSSGGSRELYIAVPGVATALVKITAISAKGSYEPTGGTGIDLLGGSAVEIPLPALAGVDGAIKISANVPVTAAMLVPGGLPGAAGALAVGAGQVEEQGVLADSPVRSAGSTELVLSAPAGPASVKITERSAAATSQVVKTVQVKAGSSVLVPVSSPAGSKATALTVVLTPLPGSGPVYAGQIVRSGAGGQLIIPVTSSLTWVPLPAVQDSVSDFIR